MNHAILRCLKKIDQLVEEAIHDHDIDVSRFDIAFAELACAFAEQPEPLRTLAQARLLSCAQVAEEEP